MMIKLLIIPVIVIMISANDGHSTKMINATRRRQWITLSKNVLRTVQKLLAIAIDAIVDTVYMQYTF